MTRWNEDGKTVGAELMRYRCSAKPKVVPRAGLEPGWSDRRHDAGCALTFYRFDITRVPIPSSSVLSRCVSLESALEGDMAKVLPQSMPFVRRLRRRCQCFS